MYFMSEVTIAPEDLDAANAYLGCGCSLEMAANEVGVSRSAMHEIITKPDVKRYIDNVFLDQGYLNRARIADVLNTMIAKKLEDAELDEEYTKADLLELLKFAHKMRQDEERIQIDKEKGPRQTNVQINNNAENSQYGLFLKQLLEDD